MCVYVSSIVSYCSSGAALGCAYNVLYTPFVKQNHIYEYLTYRYGTVYGRCLCCRVGIYTYFILLLYTRIENDYDDYDDEYDEMYK